MESNSSRSCPGLEVLDFRPHYPCYNFTDTQACEEEWPCELRNYWLELHPFVDITRAFLSYGSAVIIILGVILNGLSFYVLVASGLAKNGSGIYLLALAVCDSGNLIANIGIGVLRGAWPDFNQYFMENEWLCRFHGVFVEIFQTISAWVVVAFTIERCLAVWYPMMLRHSRNHRSKVVVTSLTSIFSLFCLSKLFLTGFEKDSVFGYIPCNSRRFVWQGMAYVRVAFQTWIPTILVFLCNCLTFWKLRRIKTNRKTIRPYRQNPGQMRDMNGHMRSRSFITKPSPTNPMLIAVSVAYLVLVFPLGAIQTVELYWNVHRKVPIATVGEERLQYISWMMTRILVKYIRSFCFGFYQINFAINFFLYFAAGTEFRVHLLYRFNTFSRLIRTYFCCSNTKIDRNQENRPRNNNSSLSNSASVVRGVSKSASTKTLVSNLPSLDGKPYSKKIQDPLQRSLSNGDPTRSFQNNLDSVQLQERLSEISTNNLEERYRDYEQNSNVSEATDEIASPKADLYEMAEYEMDKSRDSVSDSDNTNTEKLENR